MEYNTCEICGASDGRCGLMFSSKKITGNKFTCLNCYDTLKTGNIVIHTELNRTDEEIKKRCHV